MRAEPHLRPCPVDKKRLKIAKRCLKFIIETRLNRVFSSQWLNYVSQGNALSAVLCLCNIASQTSRTTNFSKQEKLLLAEMVRDYDNKTLAKKAKAWEEILTKFNSQNPIGIKRDLSQLQGCWRRLKLLTAVEKEHDLHRREARKTGGGKVPASPSEVSKLVADVIPASVSPLEQEFNDEAGEELDLRRDMTRGKLLHAK